jgi:hypothetical protein
MEMVDAAEREEIVLGGCIVGPEQPTHQCVGCRQEYLQREDGTLTAIPAEADWE